MGIAKDLLAEKEKYYNKAFEILLEINAIKCCEIHTKDYFYTTDALDEKQIYAYATERLKKDKEFKSFNDFKLFDEEIKRILNDAGVDSDCPLCDKLYNE